MCRGSVPTRCLQGVRAFELQKKQQASHVQLNIKHINMFMIKNMRIELSMSLMLMEAKNISCFMMMTSLVEALTFMALMIVKVLPCFPASTNSTQGIFLK